MEVLLWSQHQGVTDTVTGTPSYRDGSAVSWTVLSDVPPAPTWRVTGLNLPCGSCLFCKTGISPACEALHVCRRFLRLPAALPLSSLQGDCPLSTEVPFPPAALLSAVGSGAHTRVRSPGPLLPAAPGRPCVLRLASDSSMPCLGGSCPAGGPCPHPHPWGPLGLLIQVSFV